MLERLAIRDFSLLRDVTVELPPGLTVLTGESGAGKTLIFDAVSFVLGGRPHRSLLAQGAKSCEVTLQLRLEDDAARALGEPWRSGTNTLVRRLSASGRGRLTLNGGKAAVGQIQQAAQQLFEITGQFEAAVLFNPRSHMGLLDAFGGAELAAARERYEADHGAYRELKARLRVLEESASSRAQEVDFLTFQVEELSRAAVSAGERAEVEGSLRLHQHAEQLAAAANSAAQLLGGDEQAEGAYDLAARAEEQIGELEQLLAGVESELVDAGALAEQAAALLEGLRELAGRCRALADNVPRDPGAVTRLGERLDELLRLERKYGCAADELPALLGEKRARLELLTDETQSPEALAEAVAKAEAVVRGRAQKLSALRRKAAGRLEQTSAGYFARLSFPHVQLQVELSEGEELGPEGLDAVELLISLNPGEPARPLAQVASGGEASRLLLGVKAALAERLGFRTLMLDEVEAGLGGQTASRVAEVLCELAGKRQVLAITHLPVVAAQGTTHLVARKQIADRRTSVVIEPVAGEERRAELARMFGGSGSAEERALVDQLLAG